MSEYGHDNAGHSYDDTTTSTVRGGGQPYGNAREPLQESTGNAQHQYPHGQRPLPSLSSTTSCSPALSSTLSSSSLGPLAPIPAPIPPILPTQSLGSTHHGGGSGAAGAGTSALRLRRHHLSMQRQSRHSLKNPIYLSNEFCQYRMKQKDKEKQVWPDVLEDAFLDALLLIVHMGRRKYFLHQKQHGRNMLICEYIWIAYKQSLPPGSNNPPPYTYEKAKVCECKAPRQRHKPDEDCWVKVKHPMYRERKQVSSHIQVIKNFFRFHPAYHFFFSKGSEEGGKDKKKTSPGRWYKETTDQKSFKDDPVLNALKEDRLPDVRPNYEYFGQLLSTKSRVQVSPSMCWLYLSNDRLHDQSSTETRVYKDKDGVKREEETIDVKTYHAEQGLLPAWDFPHRYSFTSGQEDWGGREKEDRSIRHTLLHEYTWTMRQTESSSVREVCDEWEVDHPELHTRLQGVIDHHNLQNAHLHSNSQCDIIHMDVTLDMHSVKDIPKGSALRPLVKITVGQGILQDHHWCVRTRFERPPELCSDGSGTTFVEDREMSFVYTHIRGCHDRNPNCDCPDRRRGNVWSVPFPAMQWAKALQLCAEYPPYLLPKDKRGTSRTKKEDDAKEAEVVTQMDLMRGTAMFQELWSSPPAAPGSSHLTWTRRAVILWTFNTVHFFDKDTNLCETPAGTNWRFLTAVDPLSPVHQERTLLSGAATNKDRVVMSPSPAYQQLLNAQMAENFSPVWSNGNVHLGLSQNDSSSASPSMPVSPLPSYGPSSLSLHGSYANGLVTPPPTAALPSSFATGFDGASSIGVHAQDLGNQNLSFLSTTTATGTESSFLTSGSFSTGPYLDGTGNNSFYDEPEDDDSDTTLQGRENGDPSSLATQQWSNLNNSAHVGNSSLSLDWGHGLPLAGDEGLPATVGSDTRLNHLGDNVRQLQHPYDAFAQVRADERTGTGAGAGSSDEYMHRELQHLQGGRNIRDGLELRGNIPADERDIWNTAASTPNCDGGQTGDNQDTATHFSQSSATWEDDFGQYHPQQQQQQQQRHQHHDGLSTGDSRQLPEYAGGSSELSPLINRKRSRDEDDGDTYSLGAMRRYGTPVHEFHSRMGHGKFAPTAVMDCQDGQSWTWVERPTRTEQ
ncbi:Regulatory protein abaA [Cytospora mali]|uniref:Regulatory protein abaA n=1 Tax=Cytospora mali TaxID=578113 RepID=A0A194V493_CYTMA|nr:Regulatory protein abaA [Valsa mali var. pyri (nom. inval.)]